MTNILPDPGDSQEPACHDWYTLGAMCVRDLRDVEARLWSVILGYIHAGDSLVTIAQAIGLEPGEIDALSERVRS